MKLTTALLAVGVLAGLPAHAASSAPVPPYRVAGTLPVGGNGGWDYLTVDSAHQLLYVPRTTHVQVLRAETGALVADIPGQKHNHGVALVPSAGRGFITDGDAAAVVIFDLKTNRILGSIKVQDDADGIVYDPASDKVLVVCGDAGTLIPLAPGVDPKSGSADPAIALGGKPEFFAADGHGRVYVNLVDQNQVAVVDLKTATVVARWPVAPGGAPVGLAIDPVHGRLFVGCRKPAKLVVLDCATGHALADFAIGRGVDAVVCDDGYALASCGDGTLTAIHETAPGTFAVAQTLATAAGARTAGLDPATHTIYLPTAVLEPVAGQSRPQPKPDTFMVLKVARTP